VRLTVVRHASAGSKRSWSHADAQRPLDLRGERAADRLSRLVLAQPVRRLVSSPATRCIQTLGPIAERRDLPIELWDGLAPDADASNLLSLFANNAFDDAVICTHGEVMSPLLARSEFRDAVAAARLGRADLLAKGTAWRLRFSIKGKLLRLRHLAPSDPA
jgi:phosphohistidine phosphatase SixA